MSNSEQNNKNNIRPLGQIIKNPKKSVIPRSKKQSEYLDALINEKIIIFHLDLLELVKAI